MNGGVLSAPEIAREWKLADWEICATGAVSPGSEGLKAGVFAPGFRHAERAGDTEYVFCVMERRIDDVGSCV